MQLGVLSSNFASSWEAMNLTLFSFSSCLSDAVFWLERLFGWPKKGQNNNKHWGKPITVNFFTNPVLRMLKEAGRDSFSVRLDVLQWCLATQRGWSLTLCKWETKQCGKYTLKWPYVPTRRFLCIYVRHCTATSATSDKRTFATINSACILSCHILYLNKCV